MLTKNIQILPLLVTLSIKNTIQQQQQPSFIATHHMFYHSLWPYIRVKNASEATAEGIIVDVINRFLLFCRTNKTQSWKTKFYPVFETSVDYMNFLKTDFKRGEGLVKAVSNSTSDYLWLGPFISREVESPVNDWVNSAMRIVESPGAHVIVDRVLVSWKYKMIEGVRNSLNYLVLAILMSIVMGTLVFLIESRHENEYGRSLPHGVWNGFWWSVVTMTTIGYGDIVPRSHIGQFFAMFWLIFGILMGSVITATVTDAMAGTAYLGINDKEVAVLQYSWEEQIAKEWKAVVKPYKTYEDVLDAVRNRSVFAALINSDIVSWKQEEIKNGQVPLAIVYQIQSEIPIRVNVDHIFGFEDVWTCMQRHKEDIFDTPYRKYFSHIEENKIHYVSFKEMLIDDWIGALLLMTSLLVIGLCFLTHIIEKYILKKNVYIKDLWAKLPSICHKKEEKPNMEFRNSIKNSIELQKKKSIIPGTGQILTPIHNDQRISLPSLANRRHSRFTTLEEDEGKRKQSQILYTGYHHQNGGYISEEYGDITARLDQMEQNITDIKIMMTQLVNNSASTSTKPNKKFSLGQFRNKDLSGALM